MRRGAAPSWPVGAHDAVSFRNWVYSRRPTVHRTRKKQTRSFEYPKQRLEPTMSPSSCLSASDSNYLSRGGENRTDARLTAVT